jgi:hypothetical protein
MTTKVRSLSLSIFLPMSIPLALFDFPSPPLPGGRKFASRRGLNGPKSKRQGDGGSAPLGRHMERPPCKRGFIHELTHHHLVRDKASSEAENQGCPLVVGTSVEQKGEASRVSRVTEISSAGGHGGG